MILNIRIFSLTERELEQLHDYANEWSFIKVDTFSSGERYELDTDEWGLQYIAFGYSDIDNQVTALINGDRVQSFLSIISEWDKS